MPKTLKQLVQLGQEKAPEASVDDLTYLVSERANLTPSEFKLKQDTEVSSELEKQLQKDFKKLARNVSPQYILGYAWFLGYKIMVQRGVLIPRFETEELVEWALKHLHDGMKILDLGTGSGAIMVALAKEAAKKDIKDLTLYASDISDSALRICEENFLKFALDVTVRKANVLIGLENLI